MEPSLKVECDVLCPVCHLDESDVGDEEICVSTCNHTFCRPCFMKLQFKNNCCPMCRAEPLLERLQPAKSNDLVRPISESPPPSKRQPNAIGALYSNTTLKLGYDVRYHVIVIETLIMQNQIFIPFGKRQLKERNYDNMYALYDFVVYSEDDAVTYERHNNVPIGGTEAPPVYILQLMGYAQHISYQSTYCTTGSHGQSRRIHSRLSALLKFYEKYKKVGFQLPVLPWEDYRMIDFVKQEYNTQMPSSMYI